MTAVLRTQQLTKRYPGGVTAVDGIDLEVAEGDRFGFLGPNGSGKTTTVRMVLGLVYATSGDVEVFGRAIPKHTLDVLPSVGALVEGPAFYRHLSGRTNLDLADASGPGGARSTRKRRVNDALERVGLTAAAHRKVKTYSLGMVQRLGLAAALLRQPRMLVLDEPTNGLDPAGIREVRDLLIELNEAGTTVFLSSHLLAEVEQLCTRAAIVHEGRLVAQERVETLLAPTGRVHLSTSAPADARRVLGKLRGPRLLAEDAGELLVQLDGFGPAQLNAALVKAGVPVDELRVQRPTLEDVFLELTGVSIRDVDSERPS